MDPNAALAELRKLAGCFADVSGEFATTAYRMDTGRELADDAARMAELIEALDQWISRGGFLPDAWRNPR